MSTSGPRPFRKDEVTDYERRRYRGLDQRIVHNRELRILGRIFDRIGAGRALRVVDAPCGYGRFSTFLLERTSLLLSSDYSPAMVERAVAREAGGRRPAGFVSDLKTGLALAPDAVEAVFSMRFFHHLHEAADRRAVLAEYARVSRAWAVVSFYRLNPLHRFQRFIRRRLKHTRYRIKMLARDEFVSEARETGWEVEKIYPLIRGIHGQQIALLRKRAHQRSASG
jgi:SAM-dependent methyltransferase